MNWRLNEEDQSEEFIGGYCHYPEDDAYEWARELKWKYKDKVGQFQLFNKGQPITRIFDDPGRY